MRENRKILDLSLSEQDKEKILKDVLYDQWRKNLTESLKPEDFNTWFFNKYGKYMPTDENGKPTSPLSLTANLMTQQDIEDEKRKWAADPEKKGKEWDMQVSEKPVRQFDGQDYYLVYKINVKSPDVNIRFNTPR